MHSEFVRFPRNNGCPTHRVLCDEWESTMRRGLRPRADCLVDKSLKLFRLQAHWPMRLPCRNEYINGELLPRSMIAIPK